MALVAKQNVAASILGKCDGADPRHQQYQSLSFHPDGPEFASHPTPRFQL
jgi:hypothetical protein